LVLPVLLSVFFLSFVPGRLNVSTTRIILVSKIVMYKYKEAEKLSSKRFLQFNVI